MLGNFFHWFYCLPLHWAVVLVLALTALFLMLRTKFEKLILWRILVALLLVLWLYAVVRLTLLGREGSGGHYFVPFSSWAELIRGGNVEIIRSNLMNLLLFIPGGGLLISALSGKGRNFKTVLIMSLLLLVFSFAIEALQYVYAMGRVETDDLIHNTLGGFIGALMGLMRLKIKLKLSVK